MADDAQIHGLVAPGWEGVRDAFAANFVEHGEVGAGVTVHHDGRRVVDLWGGTYEEDTIQLIYSSTKGMTSALANMVAQRGQLDLEAPVTEYWPEFGAAGKDKVPVRWLLCHKAGVPFPETPATFEEVIAWDPIVENIAASTPLWEPGTAHGYHAVTFGFLVGEVLRRATGKTVGELLAAELSGPLGLDAWIGLPEHEERRLAPIVGGLTPEVPPGPAGERMRALIEQFVGPETVLGKALSCHGAFSGTDQFNSRAVRAAEIPAAGGVCDARSLSRLYAALVGDLEADDRFPAASQVFTPETVAAASTRQTEGNDRVMFFESTYGLGFWTASPFAPYGGARSFGHAGMGGSVGFADPENGIGFGYVMSKMEQNFTGDPRSRSLIRATYDAARVTPAFV